MINSLETKTNEFPYNSGVELMTTTYFGRCSPHWSGHDQGLSVQFSEWVSWSNLGTLTLQKLHGTCSKEQTARCSAIFYVCGSPCNQHSYSASTYVGRWYCGLPSRDAPQPKRSQHWCSAREFLKLLPLLRGWYSTSPGQYSLGKGDRCFHVKSWESSPADRPCRRYVHRPWTRADSLVPDWDK